MLDLNTIDDFENSDDAASYHAATQRLINSHAWNMPGATGRAMMQEIEAGNCMLGHTGCRDFWGNYVPARDEVKAGTKGSFEFVEGRAGQIQADAMACLD